MANLINLEQVTKTYGTTVLLDAVSLGVQAGERIGVVGLNGGGKSTLLGILSGTIEPDAGRVSRQTGLRFAMVTQTGELPEDGTVGSVVLRGFAADHGLGQLAEHQWAADPRVRSVLAGIGIAEWGLDTPVAQLSGGQRRRVALAAALVRQLDLLILDEPTNHLDIEGAAWLARHVLRRRGALVVVTHDRWFLDTVAERTWEVVDGRVDGYLGGYGDWIFARAQRARQADAAESRRRNLARKELAWLRRGPPARTSKPRYRIETAEALIADVPEPRDTVQLSAFAEKRLGRVVVELENATVTTPDGRPLVRDTTWRLAPGERIGLVGVNGSGKTTLLRALAGATPLAAGRRVVGQTVRLGWLRQELDDLPGDLRVLEALQEIAERVVLGAGAKKIELSASALAERLGFAPARQRARVSELSGGERRRLQMTRILLAEPNVLLLDEPTNDLDIDTLQQLEDVLDGWAGTLVVISHDRFLIERLCDSVWALFGDGRLTHLPGGIQQYLQLREDTAPAAPAPAKKSSPEQPRDAAAWRAARKELTRLERTIDKLTAETDEVHHAMAAVAAEPEQLSKLSARLRAIENDKDAAEQRWLELVDEV